MATKFSAEGRQSMFKNSFVKGYTEMQGCTFKFHTIFIIKSHIGVL